MTESMDREERTRGPEPSDGESLEATELTAKAEARGPDAEETEAAEAEAAASSRPSRRRLPPPVRAGIPSLALLILLAAAFFIPGVDLPATGSDAAAVGDLDAVVTALPAGAPVLVDIDADLG